MAKRERKNLLPAFLLAILIWIALAWLVCYREPINNLLIASFFALLFLTVFLTAALVFANTRRGLLMALVISLSLLFRYYQVGNLLNIVLLVGIFIILELYLS